MIKSKTESPTTRLKTLLLKLSELCSPYFLLAMDRTLWSFVVYWSIVVAFAFTLVAAVVVQITLENVVRVYPGTVQGLTFYLSEIYIYITKYLLVLQVKSLYCGVLGWLQQ